MIEDLAHSKAAPPDLSIAKEGQAGATFGTPQGAFMVNWTYIWHNYDSTQPDVAKDIGYAMYPETVQGDPSRPPYGGIGIGVSTYSKHIDEANQAAACLVEPKQQATNGGDHRQHAGEPGRLPGPADPEAVPGSADHAVRGQREQRRPPHRHAVLE